MQNSDREKQDQRTSSGMEDTAITIEFLRARLLSERSVSRSARQRAEELARRVAELEEQLKIVSLQRKKAEKATADVLAILENNGISDISEAYYSSSDQETPCESKVGNSSNKEEGNTVNSKMRRNESEELSGSEVDFSSESQRGLPWKGRKGSTEKYKDSYVSRRRSFRAVGSSPKYREGKSCRQSRRRESKSEVEELKSDSVKIDSQENGVATSLKVSPDHSDVSPEILKRSFEAQEKDFALKVSHSGCIENENIVTSGDIDFNEHEGDKDMEKALEHQAQLIGRYEEMEKAQQEWEERFRENNNSTPDSCDPGNQSDVTEEREEIRAQQCPAGTVNCVNEAKSEDVCLSNKESKTPSNGFLLPSQGDMQDLGDQKRRITPASESLAQDFAFSTTNGKKDQESMINNQAQPSSIAHFPCHPQPRPHGSPGKQSAHVSSNRNSTSSRGEFLGGRNELYALVSHETSSGKVLEVLKQARLSLQQQLSRLPLTETESVGKATEPSVPATRVWDKLEIPGGSAGLFRLPTDFAVEESRANFLASSSQLSLANYYPSTSLGVTGGGQLITNSYVDTRSTFSTDNFLTAGDQLINRPYMDGRSSYSTDDRLFSSQYLDNSSRISSQMLPFNGNFGAGLPSSRQYNHPAFSSYPDRIPQIPAKEGLFRSSTSVGMPPNLDAGLPSSSPYTHPTFSSYPDLMSRIPPNGGLSTFPSSRSVGMPPATHQSFYNDLSRPNMYR